MTAKVSVVMSVYNGERFLREAVDSILGQTFSDFEFIIVDDGSCEGSRRILESYTDRRIVLVANGVNLGLARSLNKAFDLARGAYLARMDADDIALPERLGRQAAFLDRHQDIGILGSSARLIDENGRDLGPSHADPDDLQIRWRSLMGNCFQHPTVMLRRSVLLEHDLKYDEGFDATQDYDLWVRMLHVTRAANLSEALLLRRIHDTAVSTTRQRLQLDNQRRVALRTIREEIGREVMSQDVYQDLWSLLVSGRPLPWPPADQRRCILLDSYLDLLESFANNHENDPKLDDLLQDATFTVARVALHPPLRPGLGRLLRRAYRLNPTLPVYFTQRAIKAAGRRIRRHS